MKITVLGDGGWGTAAAIHLLGNGHQVTLWGPFPDYLDEMRASGRNERFLKGVGLPPELAFQGDLATALATAELVLHVIPTQYARQVLMAARDAGGLGATPLVSLTKGIEVGSLRRLSELVAEVLGSESRYAVLSGPSHAEEVARGVPTAVVTASVDGALAKQVQDAFMSDSFRVYTSDDVVGVELGGSLKNVYAIAAGISDGLALGDNPKAALVTRGIAEMARLGQALGGRPETFSGLSGVGDMIVTCMSGHSRNRYVGHELGRGQSLSQIQQAMGLAVAEGVKTAESARDLAARCGVEVPIVEEVHAMLYADKDPRLALRDLMGREARPELD